MFGMGIAWQYKSGSKHRIVLKWWLLINIALMPALSAPSLLGFASPADSDHAIHAQNVDPHVAHHGHSGNPSESNEDGTQGKRSACVGHRDCKAKCCKTCIYGTLALIAFFTYAKPLKNSVLPPLAATHLSDYIPPLLERPPM